VQATNSPSSMTRLLRAFTEPASSGTESLTGAPWLGHGAINGWLNYEVSSPTAPNAEYVPYLEPASFSQGSVVNQMFGGTGTIIGGGHYDYTYTGVPGWPYGLYTQVG
jgi:hypothetical protein